MLTQTGSALAYQWKGAAYGMRNEQKNGGGCVLQGIV